MKAKKLLSLALCLALLISAIPMFTISASAATEGDFTYGDFTYIVRSNKYAAITGYTGDGGDVIIPSTFGEYMVACIDDYAFSGCESITSIKVPDSVSYFGIGAFSGCTALESINIPNKVSQIRAGTFQYCRSLKEITVPSSVSSIGLGAFKKCDNLEYITLPFVGSSKWAYNDNVLYGYFGYIFGYATRVVFEGTDDYDTPYYDTGMPEGTTVQYTYKEFVGSTMYPAFNTISYCFYIPSSLKVVKIGLCSTKWVSNNAFRNCSGFKIEFLPHTYSYDCDTDCNDCGFVRTPGEHTYDNVCDNVCNMCDELRDAPHVYDHGCDVDCNDCGFVRTPELHVYDSNEDADCNVCGYVRDLSVLTFGTCGENISWELNSATNTLTLIGEGATYDYLNLINVNPFIEHRANINKIVIDSGITHLGNRLFRGLNSLTEVTFGKDVATMGYEVFYGDTALEKVTFNSKLTNIGALSFYGCTALESIAIPSTVKDIANRAFKGSGLTTVDLPDSVKTLGYEVFMDCANLESVDYTRGASMLNPRMFENCTSLKTFNFTDNMCRIRTRAFYGCTALESITFEDANEMWGSSNGQEAKIVSDAFDGCNSTLKFIAKSGSHVETYANNHGFTFVAKY